MAVGLITSCDTLIAYNVSYGGFMNPGTIYYLTFTGGTPDGCYTYNGVGASPTDTVSTISVGYGDCPTCISSNTTPTPTPTLTQTPTPSGVFYEYYLTGCCANVNLQIISTVDLTGLTVGQTAYVVWNNNTQSACFTVVSPQVGYTVYYWDTINDFYQISADPGNLPPFADCTECIAFSEEPCVTPTPTTTPTETPTPTITQSSSCTCRYVNLTIDQTDLNSASGNTDPSLNGKVFYQYNICDDPNPMVDQPYTVSGSYLNNVCILSSQFAFSLMYYYQDDNVIDSQTSPGLFNSTWYLGDCCIAPTPTQTVTSSETPTPTPTPTVTNTQTLTPTNTETLTPTVTNTQTQTLTPTNTETPTPTPTITQTEPYDVYLFAECGNPSNQFRYEYVPGILIVGDVYLISGPYFNGYATVIPYVATGPLYNSSGSVFLGVPSCPTPTPTPTVTQTQTVTPTITPTTSTTPTVTPTNGVCSSTYCFRTTLSTLSGYSGNYTQTGTYNANYYYEGDGLDFGVVYYTGDRWCLSDTLGGTCLLEGAVPCYSVCPDISANYFNGGPCPTPTPSPVNCESFDFNAYFDCDWEPLPTPTPSVDCADVDFNVSYIPSTPTPTGTVNACGPNGVSFSICQYNPSTPTATPTPTVTLTKTVDVQGQATFVMMDEMFNCVNVKVLVDCQTGEQLYTSDNLIYSGTPIGTGITISAIISGDLRCVTYSGISTNISSNCYIDDIISISSSCGTCNAFPSPTPTQSPTTTPTPSSTQYLVTQTPTTSPTNTPTPTSHWVYVYESCEPIGQQLINTQIIQTVKVIPSTVTVGKTFQDNQGKCWKYMGQFTSNYAPPVNVFPITYTGNYFGGLFQAAPIFDNCTDCLNWQGYQVTFYGTYTPNANSAQNACLSYNTGRPYYTNTTILAVGVRVYDTFTSVPTNGNNNWIVLKLNTGSSLGKAVQINTSGYITAIQSVDTNSC